VAGVRLPRKPTSMATAALAAVAMLLPACGSQTEQEVPPGDHVQVVAPSAEAEFGVLRGRRLPEDRLPAGLSAGRVIAGLGLHVGKSRLALTSGLGRFYLVPGRRQSLCLLSTDRVTGACWPKAVLGSGNALSTALCMPDLPHHSVEIAGVVPDEVDSVEVVSSDRTSRRVAVHGNVYVLRIRTLRSIPRAVVREEDGATHRLSAGISPALIRRGCQQHRPPT
jgi:hypothetical protein